MKIAEIFTSIQGESTYTGLPCTFIRFAGCNLRCTYCDTPYAFEEGEELTLGEVMDKVQKAGIILVELTGGEPLLQEECYELMDSLRKKKYSVLVETNGTVSVEKVAEGIVKIVDFKCPSSGMSAYNDFSNVKCLDHQDEVKFVIGAREDFAWAREVVDRYTLVSKCKVLFSPVVPTLEARKLAGWILEEKLPVRLQLQLHKLIWPECNRGV